jgi:hypothetical protein
MPYIKQEDREEINTHADQLANLLSDGVVLNPGELNYAITRIITQLKIKPSYAQYNAIVGALECCKLELYRRGIAPYEDQKIKENGDVY